MIKADPAKGEHGEYRLLVEGVDNDGDEAWNEDGPGGVDFNLNFPFQYPYFKPGAGPQQVSEPETRAVADFAYDHPNIFLVLTIGPQDNINQSWESKPDKGAIKQSLQADDSKHLKRIAKKYKQFLSPKDAPKPGELSGAFAPWAYFHFGRWSIAARGWWPPKPPPDSEGEEESIENEASSTAEDREEKLESKEGVDESPEEDSEIEDDKEEDNRGRRDLWALRWLESQQAEGFVDWTEIDHPDFPGKRVEVGGFKPGADCHPPIDQLDASSLVAFLNFLVGERARIEFLSAGAEDLGSNLIRVKAEIINRGGLPTVSRMGETSKQLQRLMLELKGPEGLSVLAGPARQTVGVLAPGEVSKKSWLVRLPENTTAASLLIKAGEPSVGFVEAAVETPSRVETRNRGDQP